MVTCHSSQVKIVPEGRPWLPTAGPEGTSVFTLRSHRPTHRTDGFGKAARPRRRSPFSWPPWPSWPPSGFPGPKSFAAKALGDASAGRRRAPRVAKVGHLAGGPIPGTSVPQPGTVTFFPPGRVRSESRAFAGTRDVRDWPCPAALPPGRAACRRAATPGRPATGPGTPRRARCPRRPAAPERGRLWEEERWQSRPRPGGATGIRVDIQSLCANDRFLREGRRRGGHVRTPCGSGRAGGCGSPARRARRSGGNARSGRRSLAPRSPRCAARRSAAATPAGRRGFPR
jgi:hypothetical protein